MRFSSWLRHAKPPARPRRTRLFVEGMEDRLTPAAGQLDPTFGTGGVVTTNIGGPTQVSGRAAVATQPDGKVVAVGTSTDAYAGGNRVAVVRYNADGSLDPTFGTGGEVVLTFATATAPVTPSTAGGVAVDAAGRIVVAGVATLGNSSAFAAARLTPAGLPDPTFGTGGRVVLPGFGGGSVESDAPAGVALDPAGRIVLAGTTSAVLSGTRMAAARLNADGSLDPTFGTGGEVALPLFGFDATTADTAFGVAVDPAGRAVLGGAAFGIISGITGTRMAAARLTPDGRLDPTFGAGGVVTLPRFGTAPTAENDFARGVTLDPAGRILLAGVAHGSFPDGAGDRIAAARLTSAGTLDATFGSGGEVMLPRFTPSSLTEDDTAAGVAVDPAGRIVLGGTASSLVLSGTQYRFAAARLTPTGSPDPTFGTGGEAVVSTQSVSASAGGATLDGSGRLLVVGTFYPNLAVVRVSPSGGPDAGWGGGGLVTTVIPGTSTDTAGDVTVTQPDGKVVVVATSQPQGGPVRLEAVRYDPDGTLDGTFGQGGTAAFEYSSGLYLTPRSVAVDAAGRLVVAGRLDQYAKYDPNPDFGVVRLNPDGSPDTGFGTGGRATVHFANYQFVNDTGPRVAVGAAGDVVLAANGNIDTFPYSGAEHFAVAHLTPAGTLDAGFGTGGKAVIDFGTPGAYTVDTVSGVAIDAAGRIVVAGTTSADFSYSGARFAVARLETNGTPDASFGTGGKTTIRFGTYQDIAAGVALDPAGRIVVGGTTYNSFGSALVAARLTTDGSLDPTFGTGGEAAVGNPDPAHGAIYARRVAVDAVGRIAVAGIAYRTDSIGADFAAALLKPTGVPDVDFGLGGVVTTAVGVGYDTVGGAAFDPAGRLVVAGTAPSVTGNTNLAVLRYLPHDQVIDAGSPTFAADLQAAVTALRPAPPPGTPRVVVHVSSAAQMAKVAPALAGLSASPAGPPVEVLLDVDAGSYTLGTVTVPAGLKLVIDGDGGAAGVGTFASSAGPVLTVAGGSVDVRDGARLTETGTAPAVVVQGGVLTVRGSTLAAAGSGTFARLTGPNDVTAFDTTFALDGAALADDFQIENRVDHSLNGYGPGTVYWRPNQVFVSTRDGVVQRGVDVIPAGGTVSVQAGVHGDFAVGTKPLSVAYPNGLTVTQQADTLDPGKRSLVVWDFGSNNATKFVPGTNPGDVQVNADSFPRGTFRPTGRLVGHVFGNGDDMQVDSGLTLPAWLDAYGANDRLRGGGGNDVLLAYCPGTQLDGGGGRNFLMGAGGDRLVSGGQDILIAGSTYYTDEVSLAAIMAEWTSADSLAARIANLSGDTASPLYSAARLNGDYFLVPYQSVYGDGGTDTVTAGSGADWVFASASDKVTGLTRGDTEVILGG
jgi:uncharacterized delta-60 repeat protein